MYDGFVMQAWDVVEVTDLFADDVGNQATVVSVDLDAMRARVQWHADGVTTSCNLRPGAFSVYRGGRRVW